MPAAFSCSFFSFREMKLQSFEFDLIDVIPTNVQIISHLVFFLCFHWFYVERNFCKVLWCFWSFFTNLLSFEWLYCVSGGVTSSTRMNSYNMLIVAYIVTWKQESLKSFLSLKIFFERKWIQDTVWVSGSQVMH